MKLLLLKIINKLIYLPLLETGKPTTKDDFYNYLHQFVENTQAGSVFSNDIKGNISMQKITVS